jgi:hypothetical protein
MWVRARANCLKAALPVCWCCESHIKGQGEAGGTHGDALRSQHCWLLWGERKPGQGLRRRPHRLEGLRERALITKGACRVAGELHTRLQRHARVTEGLKRRRPALRGSHHGPVACQLHHQREQTTCSSAKSTAVGGQTNRKAHRALPRLTARGCSLRGCGSRALHRQQQQQSRQHRRRCLCAGHPARSAFVGKGVAPVCVWWWSVPAMVPDARLNEWGKWAA